MLLLSSVQSETNTPSLQPQEETEQLFEQAWRAYPPRCGANPRAAALRAWCARIREGVAPAAMLAGVKRYREWADSCKKTNTQWVMTAGKFFGPDHLFEDHWALPSQPEQGLETGGRIGRLIAEEMNERRRRSLQEGGAA